MSASEYRPLGVLGTGVALLGGVLVVVAFLGLDWQEPTSLSADFAQLNHATAAAGTRWLAAAYFSWLAWLLLAAALVLALAANVPSGAAPVARVAGVLVGLGGAAATVFAIQLTGAQSLHSYMSTVGLGYWFAVVGFVLLAAGAAVGVGRPQAPAAASSTSASEMPSTNRTVSR